MSQYHFSADLRHAHTIMSCRNMAPAPVVGNSLSSEGISRVIECAAFPLSKPSSQMKRPAFRTQSRDDRVHLAQTLQESFPA